MCATYADKQKRLYFNSFANKIFTGIREINPEYAEKRAIWELFQNALDTITEDGFIEITKTVGGMIFKHNGRPFSDDEFGGLIKQFSVGKTYGDNTEHVGQYGTGFISTHIYGKIIIVNGSIKMDDGSFKMLRDFKIDRQAESIDELTDKVIDQDLVFETLCMDTQALVDAPIPFTSFEYLADENQMQHIDAMLSYVKDILSFIFCFNDKLKEVRFTTKQICEIYRRSTEATEQVLLLRNDVPIYIPMMNNEDRSVRVIMGSENINLDGIPKQFLYYPLMETADAGTNFIIHAKDFKPNKERDYLYKDLENTELKPDVEMNQDLLRTGFNLVVKHIENDDNIVLPEVSKLKFAPDDSAFETKLKRDYIEKIKDLHRIKIGENKYSLSSFYYFDESVLSVDPQTIEAIYTVLSQFRVLPPFDEFITLSFRINNWNENIPDKFPVLTINDIAKIVALEGKGNYFYMKDKCAFRKVISEIAKDIQLLNELELIPNIHGNYQRIENLVKWEHTEPELIEIMDSIAANISKKYIHDDFVNLRGVTSYNREKFKDDFSNLCQEFIEGIIKQNGILVLGTTRFTNLVQALKDFVALNKKTVLNTEVASFFERVF